MLNAKAIQCLQYTYIDRLWVSIYIGTEVLRAQAYNVKYQKQKKEQEQPQSNFRISSQHTIKSIIGLNIIINDYMNQDDIKSKIIVIY